MRMTDSSLFESIFVSIASYRDSECKHTIVDLFQKAKHPSRIFLGVCLQNHPDCPEEDVFSEHQSHSQVRIHRMNWKDAKGPCLARSICQTMWDGEDYFLQIDSHMRFVQSWDEKLIQMLKQCPSSKPILTTYPVDYQLPDIISKEYRPPVLVADRFDENGMLRLKGSLLISNQSSPIPSLYWVAGFSFSKSNVIQEVPYDLNLPFLFFGEEMLMMSRLWTHGWDFYAPGENIIFHLWDRGYRSTFREIEHPKRNSLQKRSLERVRTLLGMTTTDQMEEESMSTEKNHPLGKHRSLPEYEDFCGVSFNDQLITDRAKRGGLPFHLFLDSVFQLISNKFCVDNDGKQKV